MATRFYLHPIAAGMGSASDDNQTMTTTGPGSSTTSLAAASVAGPTAGIPFQFAGRPSRFWAPRLAPVTISGTVTFNLWANESNMANNGGLEVLLEYFSGDGTTNLGTIVDSERGTELSTTQAVNNWTAAPTSTTLNNGDRIRATVLVNDVGTMASGGSFGLFYDNTAASFAESWVEFTETITNYIPSDPPVSRNRIRNGLVMRGRR